MKLKHQLPDIYHKTFPAELLNADRSEKKATCDDCAMGPEKRGHRAKITYDPNLKCCTFEPFIPNYLVGALLSQKERFPVGVRAIQKKIRNREYALPIGLTPTLAFQVEFNSKEAGEFGNREDFLCPYYNRESQNCGIWKYRGAVCTTFFCMSDAGKPGQRFWNHLANYLSYTEMALLEEALVELDFSPRQMSEQLDYLNRHKATPAELRALQLPEKKWKELWNGYADGIEDFYIKCYQLVSSWSHERQQEALGDWGQGLQNKVLSQLRRLEVREQAGLMSEQLGEKTEKGILK